MFAFAGGYRLGLEWTHIDARNPRKLVASTNQLEGPFLHFETKLLWVEELMRSKIAKAQAQQRHEFMIAFLCQYEGEFAFTFPAMAAHSSSPINRSSLPTGSRSGTTSRATLFDGPLAD